MESSQSSGFLACFLVPSAVAVNNENDLDRMAAIDDEKASAVELDVCR